MLCSLTSSVDQAVWYSRKSQWEVITLISLVGQGSRSGRCVGKRLERWLLPETQWCLLFCNAFGTTITVTTRRCFSLFKAYHAYHTEYWQKPSILLQTLCIAIWTVSCEDQYSLPSSGGICNFRSAEVRTSSAANCFGFFIQLGTTCLQTHTSHWPKELHLFPLAGK